MQMRTHLKKHKLIFIIDEGKGGDTHESKTKSREA